MQGKDCKVGIQTPENGIHRKTKTSTVGSKIPTSLDFEWLKRGWVANSRDF